MIKSKKQMYLVMGVFALVLMLGTITYAFFNYTRTGTANVIRTGKISFNSTQGQTINLTNMFPIDVSNGIPNDATKVGTVIINVTGDTTYTEGLEYLVSAVDVSNTVGSGVNAKQLPISIDVSVSNNTENDPATTLGTADSNYYTNRGGNTSIYKVLAGDTISNGDGLVAGYIAPGATGVDGNIVIKAYLDKTKIAITDTYNGNESDNMGTTTTWVNGRETFTTTEWNSLQTNGVSFKVKVESNEGIWINGPICIKATTLHTETCNKSSNFCYADGYYLGGTMDTTTITYGNLVTSGNVLSAGDAFDCDVNGNGNYTERFYYISDYYDTESESFDNTTAALIYYNNVNNGIANVDAEDVYASIDDLEEIDNSIVSVVSYYGPITAIKHLPSTNTWSNVSLKKSTRAIKGEDTNNHNVQNTIYSLKPFNQSFSYGDKAARLASAYEIMQGCGLEYLSNDSSHNGELSTNCKFLYENTAYSGSQGSGESFVARNLNGLWIETPEAMGYDAWSINAQNRKISSIYSANNYIGIRPVIDVPYSRIDY